jgi:hypothetical protein
MELLDKIFPNLPLVESLKTHFQFLPRETDVPKNLFFLVGREIREKRSEN